MTTLPKTEILNFSSQDISRSNTSNQYVPLSLPIFPFLNPRRSYSSSSYSSGLSTSTVILPQNQNDINTRNSSDVAFAGVNNFNNIIHANNVPSYRAMIKHINLFLNYGCNSEHHISIPISVNPYNYKLFLARLHECVGTTHLKRNIVCMTLSGQYITDEVTFAQLKDGDLIQLRFDVQEKTNIYCFCQFPLNESHTLTSLERDINAFCNQYGKGIDPKIIPCNINTSLINNKEEKEDNLFTLKEKYEKSKYTLKKKLKDYETLEAKLKNMIETHKSEVEIIQQQNKQLQEKMVAISNEKRELEKEKELITLSTSKLKTQVTNLTNQHKELLSHQTILKQHISEQQNSFDEYKKAKEDKTIMNNHLKELEIIIAKLKHVENDLSLPNINNNNNIKENSSNNLDNSNIIIPSVSIPPNSSPLSALSKINEKRTIIKMKTKVVSFAENKDQNLDNIGKKKRKYNNIREKIPEEMDEIRNCMETIVKNGCWNDKVLSHLTEFERAMNINYPNIVLYDSSNDNLMNAMKKIVVGTQWVLKEVDGSMRITNQQYV